MIKSKVKLLTEKIKDVGGQVLYYAPWSIIELFISISNKVRGLGSHNPWTIRQIESYVHDTAHARFIAQIAVDNAPNQSEKNKLVIFQAEVLKLQPSSDTYFDKWWKKNRRIKNLMHEIKIMHREITSKNQKLKSKNY